MEKGQTRTKVNFLTYKQKIMQRKTNPAHRSEHLGDTWWWQYYADGKNIGNLVRKHVRILMQNRFSFLIGEKC